jgi:predicted transport protein
MAIYSIKNNLVKKIPPIKIGLEKDIQILFENSLDEILNITFLASEYSTSFGGRIDSLGIDNNGSPVIIEYKKGQNDNVINQGLSYLRWLLDYKADFEVLASKNKISVQIDWDSPRVICVAESYNKFDLDTADLLPMNIELLKYKIYENDVLVVDLETQQKVRISTSKVFAKKEKSELKEKIQYTLEDHLSGMSKEVKKIFDELKERIISLDDNIIEEAKAKYIAYKLTTNFVDIVVLKDSLKLFLNIPSGSLNDPQNHARDLAKPKKIGHWGNGDYEVKITPDINLEEIFELIKQSYNFNK